jgi:hypothetical protein
MRIAARRAMPEQGRTTFAARRARVHGQRQRQATIHRNAENSVGECEALPARAQ